MASAEHTPAQWRLRILLLSSALASGAAWGAIGVSLASDADARPALTAHGGIGVVSLPTVLLTLSALPLGSLIGAPVLDFVSHTCGRRPAMLAGSALTVLGCLIATVEGPLLRTIGIGVVGLGMGGYAIVVPKLAHELAEHGHRRLMPRVRATAPAGAALAVLAGALGALASPSRAVICAWTIPLLVAMTSLLLALSLPETPHWFAAQGRVETAYAALRRMVGELEAGVGIDWVMMDAGTRGEQHPLGRGDLSISRVRHTVIAGLLFELVQALPLGLAALCLGPALLVQAAEVTSGTPMAAPPIGATVALASAWVAIALLGARRHGDRLAYAWILGGTGLSACGITLLALSGRAHGAGLVVLLIVVNALLVAGQFTAVVPACTGGIDPLVPPWLLRSQRRATAMIRPLVQLVAVIGPTLLLALAPRPAVALGAVLGCQMGSLLVAVSALPRALAALH
ncbi:MFS transporter [Actinomyces sp.]|uniref:MFS transporter n=1 Tax=Actinomyces sp. TaxID=29317 RepID=UPI0026DD35C6|nr:MFS transporter [Actinomyces sp.]MDO4899175.1 MFS transporter [Actinomyces sp.]